MAKLGGSATSTMNTFDGESTVKRQTPLVSSAANKIVSTRATRKSLTGIVIKITLILLFTLGIVFFLNRIDFPAPKKDIQKIIPNEKFKIVK